MVHVETSSVYSSLAMKLNPEWFPPKFAELLGTSSPVLLLAAMLVVTAVSFLVAQQPAVLMAMAVR